MYKSKKSKKISNFQTYEKIENTSSWFGATLDVILEIVEIKGYLFTRKNILSKIDKISENTKTVGKTPAQTLSKVLQDLRDEGLISFKKPGEYYLDASISEINTFINNRTNKSMSKGENKIYRYLKKNKIEFKKEKTFEELKSNSYLRFDFYLPKHNLLIEFDGKQHFEPVEFFGGTVGFLERKMRDNLKNKYAEDNNIKLLRIHYNEFININKILNSCILLS